MQFQFRNTSILHLHKLKSKHIPQLNSSLLQVTYFYHTIAYLEVLIFAIDFQVFVIGS